ncbi:MAG TPA: DNA starvation/stationary phase protection protein [Novosphingobium sp.]|nr:DNA starvation/stationary phase protection protein [Novosphingobium sp.]
MGDNARTAHVANLNGLLADAFALYIKTKNFHWHVKGPHFRDLHLLFDEQATEILALTDLIGERVRKNGAATHTSLGSLERATHVAPQDRTDLDAAAMIDELIADNETFLARLRETKATAGEVGDNATDGIVDDWTDQCEQRIWFLKQTAA